MATFSRRVWRFFKKLGILGFNKRRNIYGVNPLLISTAFIFLTLGLALVARKVVKNIFKDRETILKQLVLEFIATIELCAACFELIIVAENWGVTAYAIYLFLLTIWWSSKWEDCSACPYSPMEEVIEGSRPVFIAIFIIASQVVAALCTFRYVQVLWALELAETHIDKAWEDCTADLQVDMLTGAVIEGVATCICRLISRTLSEANARLGNVLDAFFGTMMVVAAFNLSGGYFNPALATSLKFGCEGNSDLEHFVVYWIGACTGSLLSVFIFRSRPIQTYVEKLKPKVE